MCAFFTVCASMWEGADIVLIRFLRWRLHLARIGNGTEDKITQRGNEKGKKMEERTDGIKEKGKWRLREPEEVKRSVIYSVHQHTKMKRKCNCKWGREKGTWFALDARLKPASSTWAPQLSIYKLDMFEPDSNLHLPHKHHGPVYSVQTCL